MVRIYKHAAEVALMALEWVRYQGYNVAQIRKDIGGRYPDNSSNIVYKKVMAAYANYDGKTTVEESAKIIATALEHDRASAGGERELIDRIVDVLKLPYSKNVISGSQLASLSKAILVPDELIGLSEKLKKAEQSCSSCGHDFDEGEIGVQYKQDGVRNSWLCTMCYTPKKMSCSCKKSMRLPDKLGEFLKNQNVKCDSCVGKKSKKGLGSISADGLDGGDIQIGGVDAGLQQQAPPLPDAPAAPAPPFPVDPIDAAIERRYGVGGDRFAMENAAGRVNRVRQRAIDPRRVQQVVAPAVPQAWGTGPFVAPPLDPPNVIWRNMDMGVEDVNEGAQEIDE